MHGRVGGRNPSGWGLPSRLRLRLTRNLSSDLSKMGSMSRIPRRSCDFMLAGGLPHTQLDREWKGQRKNMLPTLQVTQGEQAMRSLLVLSWAQCLHVRRPTVLLTTLRPAWVAQCTTPGLLLVLIKPVSLSCAIPRRLSRHSAAPATQASSARGCCALSSLLLMVRLRSFAPELVGFMNFLLAGDPLYHWQLVCSAHIGFCFSWVTNC